MAVKDYHRMSNDERTKMLFFLKDHISEFDGMAREQVAKICMDGIGLHVNSAHIKTGRDYLENAGVELWTESKNMRGSKQKENEKLFADVKLLTKKIDMILQYLPLTMKEKSQLNRNDYERDIHEEHKSFDTSTGSVLANTPPLEDWVPIYLDKNKEN